MIRTQYGLFQDAVALCRKIDQEKWKKATFWVFDAPGIPNRPFEVSVVYFDMYLFQRIELTI